MSIRPKQAIPEKQKDAEWVKNSARYFSGVCIPAVDIRKADILYRAANGEMEETDYLYVTNPYNSKNNSYTKFPSKIRNFDIISTNVMLLMGEKRRRGLNYTVVPLNSNIEDIRKDFMLQQVNKYLIQEFVNEVIQQEIQSGNKPDIQQSQQLSQAQVNKQVNSLQDQIAIMGQNALDYIVDFNNMPSKFAENFYHWLVTARTFSYKEPFKDEVVFECVSPKEIKYLAHSRVRFLEDCEAVVRYVRMPINEVMDKFQGLKDFDSVVIEDLESRIAYGTTGQGFANRRFNGLTDIDTPEVRMASALWSSIKGRGGERQVYSDEQGLLVEHIVWTSQVKVGKLQSTNIFGEPFIEYVDEDFKAQAGEKIEWIWVDEKRHAWIIDDRHIIDGGRLPFTQGDIEGIQKCKNPYNGRILNMKHVNPMSTVEKGLNYQIKYNIVHYYIEKCFAKNMDKIVVMPIGLIGENKGLSMEATMYYANAMSFLWVDDSKKNFQTAVNGVKVLDADLSQHIDKLYDYLRLIKEEYDSSLGITPQRKGQMQASDAVGATENSTFRSSIMTEEMFTQFEELEETDLQACMELSKIAFSEGKKAMFVKGPNLDKVLMEIDPEGFSYANYLIRVKNSAKQLEQLNAAKQQAQALTQNKQGRFSDVIKVIRSENISELLQEMQEVESNFDSQQQAQQQAEQQQQQQEQQLKDTMSQRLYDAAVYKADKIYDATIEAQTIKSGDDIQSTYMESINAENAGAEIQKAIIKREELQQKAKLEQLKQEKETERNKLDNETKRQISENQLKAARARKPNQ